MNSIHLGRVFGIDIRVHFLFVVMMLVFAGYGPAALLYSGVLFGLVLLHELGHSLVAQRFGIRVLDITFWPLGGMARMSAIPEDARIEGLIAVACPAVKFALASIAFPIALWTGAFEPGASSRAFGMNSFGDFIVTFLSMNLALGIFNLVPAFPMDGGRILRAFLGRKGNWVEATEKAVSVGRFIAILMCVTGVLWRPMLCTLPLIGLFVWWTGARELWTVRLRHGMAAPGIRFTMGGPFGNAGGGAGNGPGSGPGGGPGDPFELLRRAAQGRSDPGEQPSEPGPAEPPPRSSKGFSEEEIAEIERFRGRLRD